MTAQAKVIDVEDVKTIKGLWSEEEDRLLLSLIEVYGPSRWVEISQQLKTRTAKQCRERYHQNLRPNLNKSPISKEEGQAIKKLVARHGYRWTFIAKLLNTNRSDNSIKNWWKTNVKRKKKPQVNQFQLNGHDGAVGSFLPVSVASWTRDGASSHSVGSSSGPSSPESGGMSSREYVLPRGVQSAISSPIQRYVGDTMDLEPPLSAPPNYQNFGGNYHVMVARQVVPNYATPISQTPLVEPAGLGLPPPIISQPVFTGKPVRSGLFPTNNRALLQLQNKPNPNELYTSHNVQEHLPIGKAAPYTNHALANNVRISDATQYPGVLSSEASNSKKRVSSKLPSFEELKSSVNSSPDSRR